MVLKPRYHSYEKSRRWLVANRLQIWFRNYAAANNTVLIAPRKMRFAMRPSYLRGVPIYPSLSSAKLGLKSSDSLPIRTRRVFNNPWWAQCFIAEIYAFKINYDAKAVTMGQPIGIHSI